MVEGLTYRKKFNPAKDVDHVSCMKLLLKFKADPAAHLGKDKRKRPTPIFHAIKTALMLKSFLDLIEEKEAIVNVTNVNRETPLCLVAGEPEDNEFKAKTLLCSGASSFASELNPLHIAIRNKNHKIMRLLYKEGDASPNRNLANELNPIQLAVRQDDPSLLKEMLNWKELDPDFSFVD